MVIEKYNNLIISNSVLNHELGYDRYHEVTDLTVAPAEILLGDHITGFDQELNNIFLNHLNSISTGSCVVWQNYIPSHQLKLKYPNLQLKLHFPLWLWKSFQNYHIHPENNFKNFICSFNGTGHISRQLLVAILQKYGWFDPNYSSKNFAYTSDTIDGHLKDLVGDREIFYRKFFQHDEEFYSQVYSFGHLKNEHTDNINRLENQLTNSFVHIVSETMSTSYYPFVTEKFLYSVVTRGLFLSYAQPGWHNHLENYYGFKKYDKIFDYSFDTVECPIDRLLTLMSILSKFSILSKADLHDLYLMEHDTIEYNYNNYFSNAYLERLINGTQ